jgi:hypothetical protein
MPKHNLVGRRYGGYPIRLTCGMGSILSGGDFRTVDAQFVAAARTAVPELVAEVRRLRAERGAV